MRCVCRYYLKISVVNTRVPVASVSIRTQGQTDYAAMQPTADNAWLLFSGVPLIFPADVQLTSVLGDTVNDTIATTNLQGPPVQGSAQFPHHAELECVGGSPNRTTSPTCGDFCSSPYVEQPQPVAPGAATESALTLTNKTTPLTNNCTTSVPAFGQCGGTQGGCVNCTDHPWPGACCTSGFSCDRQSSAFWSCEEIQSVRQPNTIEPFAQCGGLDNCANTTAMAKVTGMPKCLDGPWSQYQCSSGFTCARYGSLFWRCDSVPSHYPTFNGGQTESATPITVGVATTCAGT